MLKTQSEKISRVTVELKDGLEITGFLGQVDSNLNIVLNNIKVSRIEEHPFLKSLSEVFIRGNNIRYIHFNIKEVDLDVIQESCLMEYEKKNKIK